MGVKPKIAAYHPHFGEEACLVGSFGSGTIFFSSCNLACVYCQNWEISQKRVGEEVDCRRLGEMMVELQDKGCHNINLVSPTIWVPQILKGLIFAIKNILRQLKWPGKQVYVGLIKNKTSSSLRSCHSLYEEATAKGRFLG